MAKGANVASGPKQRIEPPINSGKLAETTAPVSPEQVTEEIRLPAVSVGAVADSATVTMRELSPWLRRLGQWLLALLALYVVGWLLLNAAPALTPFIIGLVLAYLLLPIVDRLAQRMPRWLAILLVYIGGIGLLAISIAFIIPPAVDQVQQL